MSVAVVSALAWGAVWAISRRPAVTAARSPAPGQSGAHAVSGARCGPTRRDGGD
ncbi:hypothetical protein NKG94_31030 [Micromonospora sp. M12]